MSKKKEKRRVRITDIKCYPQTKQREVSFEWWQGATQGRGLVTVLPHQDAWEIIKEWLDGSAFDLIGQEREV